MQTKKNSIQRKRQGLFLLVAPPGVVLLLTVLFSAAGGGKGAEVSDSGSPSGGINVTLPGAHLTEEKGLNKMAYYKKAELDSLRQLEKEKMQGMVKDSLSGAVDSVSRSWTVADPNIEKVNRKVADLKDALRRAEVAQGRSEATPGWREGAPGRSEAPVAGSDVDRLERMLTAVKRGENGGSPEMRDINQTLDKLIAVQHPERFVDTVGRKGVGVRQEALPVSAVLAGEAVSGGTGGGGGTGEGGAHNRFYGLEGEADEDIAPMGAIEAVVPETQTLVNGALIRLELNTELAIRGDRIPGGTLLYGIAHVENERLRITINSIRYGEKIYPVALQVLDQDGLAGIYEPGSVTRDVAQGSAGESVNSIGPTGFDASLGAQAAGAGLQMARSLVSKKIRLVRVTVKAGYRVFLQDLSQKKQ